MGKTTDPMLEVYIYETQQLLENLESLMLSGEKDQALTAAQVDEVFRIMHTIKGSSSMMSFESLTRISHVLEDLFSQIRDNDAQCRAWGKIFDIVFRAIDFMKAEFSKIQSGGKCGDVPTRLLDEIEEHVVYIKSSEPEASAPSLPEAPRYKIKVKFEPGCQMEHIRAFGIVNSMSKLCSIRSHVPENLDDEASCELIVKNGFTLIISTNENPDDFKKILDETLFVQTYSVLPLEDEGESAPEPDAQNKPAKAENGAKPDQVQVPAELQTKQNFISVNVNKLDSLMDLVGELVTTEAMVTRNPDLEGLKLNNFETASRQLKSLTSELQGIVMSMRLLPVSNIFHKMERIVRDTSKKLSKNVNLKLIGEETEVDKTIIDNLSDPIMHLIRNSIDHGIESPEERLRKNKPAQGNITLEAKNTGEDVMIIVSDDGRGLDKNAIISKAREKGLTTKSDANISDKEAFSFIFLPGFSTKEDVTELSGRGVGMDVVRQSIEKLGGSIFVDSEPDKGTTTSIRIPLTLAILDGMKLTVGDLSFIAPMISIRESLVPDMKNIFLDPDGNEMIMIRGECYSILPCISSSTSTPPSRISPRAFWS
jgi:two-component system chemotaxis sensor kinase CheA